MIINFRLLLSALLLFNLVLPVFSFKPSGGVLVLDGDDDYAILPLAEHGYIIPADTFDFTVEVWFYPKSKPKRREQNLILSQQVVFGLTSNTQHCDLDKDQICCYGAAYLEGEKAHGVIGGNVEVEKDQWNYLAIIFKDGAFNFAYNNRLSQTRFRWVDRVAAERRGIEEYKSFFVGGYHKVPVRIKGDGAEWRTARFHGEIDAIRFSNIARYDMPAERGIYPFEPPLRFVPDAHTLALWNFDEPAGTDRFQDTSGNGKTLIGMNGATTSGALAVNPTSTSLTSTWGQIKSESR